MKYIENVSITEIFLNRTLHSFLCSFALDGESGYK